jgi:DNA topoisomerase VI subunit A
VKLVDISRKKKKENLKAKIEEFEHNRKIKLSETCIGATLILRSVTNLELIRYRMRSVICLQTATVFCLVEETFLSAIEYRQG